LGVECCDADQVVDGGVHLEPGPVALSADGAKLASPAERLDSPEGLFNAFAYPLRQGVSGGAAVDRRAPVATGVLGDVGSAPACSDVRRSSAGLRAATGGRSTRARERLEASALQQPEPDLDGPDL